jgi:uncharacterized membrane protein required for colicin V production
MKMKCLENITKKQIPNDVIIQSLRLYREIGKNQHYNELFKDDYEFLSKQLTTLEAYSFYRCFYTDLKIPESRLKSLQLDSTRPKNKAETLYKNILEVFNIVHAPRRTPFELTVTEIHNLVLLLYKDYYTKDQLSYNKLERVKHSLLSVESISKRESLEQMIALYSSIRRANEYELSYVNLNFMVDFMNMDIYKIPDSDVVSILIYYIICMQDGINATQYVSFFGKLLLNLKEYNTAKDFSKMNWKDGYSEINPIHRLMLRIHYELYNELEEMARDYQYESSLEISKSDYIENTIDKLNQIFSKEDIRLKHPLISDSTINRTLKRMQDENKIRPLGKGRSAKWTKLYQKESKKSILKQMNFDLGE